MTATTKPKQPFLGVEIANLIQKISNLIDRGEYQNNPYDFIEARRLLNNVLPKAVDVWVASERQAAYLLGTARIGELKDGEELIKNQSPRENRGSSEIVS